MKENTTNDKASLARRKTDTQVETDLNQVEKRISLESLENRILEKRKLLRVHQNDLLRIRKQYLTAHRLVVNLSDQIDSLIHEFESVDRELAAIDGRTQMVKTAHKSSTRMKSFDEIQESLKKLPRALQADIMALLATKYKIKPEETNDDI